MELGYIALYRQVSIILFIKFISSRVDYKTETPPSITQKFNFFNKLLQILYMYNLLYYLL